MVSSSHSHTDPIPELLPSGHSNLRHKVVLTYDNTKFTDGVGAQLQRIYGIYAISRLLGVSYLHSPLLHVAYQGLRAMESGSIDSDFHRPFNDLCQIKSDVSATYDFRSISLPNLTLQELHDLVAACDVDGSDTRPYLLRLVLPYGIADRFPNCYEACKEISPFASNLREGRVLRVAIHVRRGEQTFVYTDRILPDAYYIAVAQNVVHVLEASGIDYVIELHGETIDKKCIVNPERHGLAEAGSPVALDPWMYRLDNFSVLPHLVPCINDKAIDCFRKLATADVLIMSRSSFSYVAAILNRNGIILYHPFWHPAPSSWITVEPHGEFHQAMFRDLINARSRPE